MDLCRGGYPEDASLDGLSLSLLVPEIFNTEIYFFACKLPVHCIMKL